VRHPGTQLQRLHDLRRPAVPADDGEQDALVAQPKQRLLQDFPATKVQFLPSASPAQRDLLASGSDCLRIWRLAADGATCEKLLDVRAARLCGAVDQHA
jgi:hypothetical protein